MINKQIHLCLKFLCGFSVLSLVHCAYSAAQHRSYIRLIGQPFNGLPLDLVIQTLLSLVISIVTCSFVVGSFMPIRVDYRASKKSWDTVGNCPGLYVFEHRAKCLSPKFDDF